MPDPFVRFGYRHAEAEGVNADAGKMKTKVRRLYDIANILQSLHLLEKTQLADSRKPAFRWLGIEKRIARASPHTLKQFYRSGANSAPDSLEIRPC